jgi:hypothetical protein
MQFKCQVSILYIMHTPLFLSLNKVKNYWENVVHNEFMINLNSIWILFLRVWKTPL